MGKIEEKHNAILTRINVILGGLFVACIMLLINLIVNYGEHAQGVVK